MELKEEFEVIEYFSLQYRGNVIMRQLNFQYCNTGSNYNAYCNEIYNPISSYKRKDPGVTSNRSKFKYWLRSPMSKE
jgi:hypothetical protein